jgi:hypothetical protein
MEVVMTEFLRNFLYKKKLTKVRTKSKESAMNGWYYSNMCDGKIHSVYMTYPEFIATIFRSEHLNENEIRFIYGDCIEEYIYEWVLKWR